MGGNVFTKGEDPLHVPRMSRILWNKVTEWANTNLKKQFQYHSSPIEGPGKTDFGDVDIVALVPIPGYRAKHEMVWAIENLFSTDLSHPDPGESWSAHFAIPWGKAFWQRGSGPIPHMGLVELEEENEDGTIEEYMVLGDIKSYPTPHAQIDVQLCESREQVQWMLFIEGHGDLWSILRAIIRPYGLGVDDIGLSVREAASEDKKMPKNYLTRQPGEVLAFLGLDLGHKWDQAFNTHQDMFEYAVSCRFFSLDALEPLGISTLKNSDRRRLQQRPVYREFFEEFLPTCKDNSKYHRRPYTRELVKIQAFEMFPVEPNLEERLGAYQSQRDSLLAAKKAAAAAAGATEEDQGPYPGAEFADRVSGVLTFSRTNIVKAMKRVMLEDGDWYGASPNIRLRDAQGDWDFDRVASFVETHREAANNGGLPPTYDQRMLSKWNGERMDLEAQRERHRLVTEALERVEQLVEDA